MQCMGTKVSGHYRTREGGHSSGVAIKRGSTVNIIPSCLKLKSRVHIMCHERLGILFISFSHEEGGYTSLMPKTLTSQFKSWPHLL